MRERIYKILEKASALLPGAASFIIAISWNWYHIPLSQKNKLYLATIITTPVLLILFWLGKKLLIFTLRQKTIHPFWTTVFPTYLNRLYFSFSVLFLVFFSKNELYSLIYFAIALLFFFFILETIFQQHPAAKNWLIINRLLFIWTMFLFVFNSINQYIGYKYYILDSNVKYYNISLFRAWSMTAFWLGIFSATYLLLLQIKNKAKYTLFGIISIIFIFFVIIWMFNIGILYFSGLNISPTVLMHTDGMGNILFNRFTLMIGIFGVVILILFFIIKKKLLYYHQKLPGRYWRAYHIAIILTALFSVVGLSSFRTTPEFAIIKSFYQFLFGNKEQINLSPTVKQKLERFGIKYNYDQFKLAYKDYVYNTTIPPLVPQFQNKKPNIIIIFLESFSTRLTSVYNPQQVPNVTPGLEEMAKNPNTTIFKKYYNGSTPTVTGLLSQLCSFLPPIGHNEIANENILRSHHLLCLPKILKQNGWQYTNYITAVAKNFAHKDTIFKSMGTDEVYGTEELYDIVKSKPLSWGFSDHQLFPAMEKILKNKKEPYLAILSTVDTHPPFTLPQDMVPYKNGDNKVLNTIHTTDDAFKMFWEKFINSESAQNTIVVAVADHAIFPTAITPDYWPDVAGKLNYYDELTFMMYIPSSTLPKEVDYYSSGIDFTPTLLQILNINVPNSFEGRSIFDDRTQYPNLLGMHELGLYINETDKKEKRKISYTIPSTLNCNETSYTNNPQTPLTLCELLNYYEWKKQMLEQGRFWQN